MNNVADDLYEAYSDGFADGYKQGMKDAQPERESAEWVKNDNGTYSCSKCQSWIPKEQIHYARYCLYCGSKMERRTDEAD